MGDLNTTKFYDPITTPAAVYTTPTNDTNGKMLTVSNIQFPTEYAVSGWFKWTPTTLRSEWHEMFRLTINSPSDLQDLARLGDRTLAAWTGKSCDCYHFTSYTYNPTSPAQGQIQQYTNLITSLNLPTWAFVYFGYSRALKVSYAYVRWSDRDTEGTLTNTNHYLSNDFWFYYPNNVGMWPTYNGQIGQLRVQFGPGSFVTNKNFATTDDRFKFTVGLQLISVDSL